jgi:carboxylesterase 3/5
VFGNLRGAPTAAQLALSAAMMKSWTDFAKDPAAGPGWERVGSAGGRDLGRFTSEGKLVVGDAKEVDGNCALFKEYLDRRAAN